MQTEDRLRGSLLRCLLLTGLPRGEVAKTLTALASPSDAFVSPDADKWMPVGLMEQKEMRFHQDRGFIDEKHRRSLIEWWLAKPKGARTPFWDIASTCTIANIKGLILVEAKAHDKELSTDGKKKPETRNGWINHERIGAAMGGANDGLNQVIPGWHLSRDTHYQLCNRFAWAWKLASMGIPVILVYLGFLNATEMVDQGIPFPCPEEWEDRLRNHARGIVPDQAWETKLDVNGTLFWPLIRSVDLGFTPHSVEGRI